MRRVWSSPQATLSVRTASEAATTMNGGPATR